MGRLRGIADSLRTRLGQFPGSLSELADQLGLQLGEFGQQVVLAVVLGPRGEVVHLSPGLADLVVREGEEPLGEPWIERFVPPAERAGIERVFAAFVETGAPRHYRNRVLTASGDARLVAWENLRIFGPDQTVIGCLCLGEDVSETEELSGALRKSEGLYRAIFELVLEGIITIDVDGKIVSFNAAAEEIFGYGRDEVVGRNVSMLMGEPERAEHDGYRRRYLETGEARIIGTGRNLVGQRKDGSAFPLRLGVSDVRVGTTRLFAAAVHDLSGQRKVEEELRSANLRLMEVNRKLTAEQAKLVHAEKLSSIGLLASGVAHEINNPLMGVISCARALADGRVPDESSEEYFDTVHDGLERIRVIVAGLLDYARQRPPSPVALDPGEVIRASLRLLNPAVRAKDLRVVDRVPVSAELVRADRSQLMQAVVNLLVNAVQAVPTRGSIEIGIERHDGQVGIRIHDDGPGIPAQYLRQVCDPFFSTKPDGEGTGLGLSVTLGIARAHGGDLEIQSREGAGTTAILWLPPGETA